MQSEESRYNLSPLSIVHLLCVQNIFCLDEWTSLPALINGKMEGTLASIKGQLWAVGGRDAEDEPMDAVERFDADTGEWEEVARMKRSIGTSCVVEDPYNPVTGNYDAGSFLVFDYDHRFGCSAQYFEPTEARFSSLPDFTDV